MYLIALLRLPWLVMKVESIAIRTFILKPWEGWLRRVGVKEDVKDDGSEDESDLVLRFERA